MSDFFDGIVSRSTGERSGLQPRTPSRFETRPLRAGAGFGLGDFDGLDAESSDGAAPTQNPMFQDVGHQADSAPPRPPRGSRAPESQGTTRAEPRPGRGPGAAGSTEVPVTAAERPPAPRPVEAPAAEVPGPLAAPEPLRSTEPRNYVPRVGGAGRPSEPPRGDRSGRTETKREAAEVRRIPVVDAARRAAAQPRPDPDPGDRYPRVRPAARDGGVAYRRDPEAGQPQTIHVTIGRVEVRAPARPHRDARQELQRPAVNSAVLPLEEYLRRRSGGP